ncbi:MAG: metal-dependent transcriptional regulator [Chloroflexi bacterium]|nr:metal-dependent transcriptional regulator [Chloroflexota bacterium]
MSHHLVSADETRPTHTIEDYLMTMYVQERDQGEIVAARLAELMNVAPATVAMTFKRMERDNWISGKGRGGVHLTETGHAAASSVIRRHMLTEWLLVRILKVPMTQTHEEAHNIEHAISPALEERMREILNDPKVCPHGNPFPGFEQIVSGWIPLSDLPLNQTVTIRRLHEVIEDNHELLNYLITHNVLPGTQVQVVESLPFNQTLSLLVNEKVVTLGFSAARMIFAEKSN